LVLEITFFSKREETGRGMWVKREMVFTRMSDGEIGVEDTSNVLKMYQCDVELL
jgi:hypothetical protein